MYELGEGTRKQNTCWGGTKLELGRVCHHMKAAATPLRPWNPCSGGPGGRRRRALVSLAPTCGQCPPPHLCSFASWRSPSRSRRFSQGSPWCRAARGPGRGSNRVQRRGVEQSVVLGQLRRSHLTPSQRSTPTHQKALEMDYSEDLAIRVI